MAHIKEYTSKMDQVEPPAYLKDRVLAEVQELRKQVPQENEGLKKQTPQENEGDQNTGNSSVVSFKPRKRFVPRSAWAVAAVFVLSLVVVTISGVSGTQGGAGNDQGAV